MAGDDCARLDSTVREGDRDRVISGVPEGHEGVDEGELDGRSAASGVAPPKRPALVWPGSSSPLPSSSSSYGIGWVVCTEEASKWGLYESRKPPLRTSSSSSAMKMKDHRPKDAELKPKLT
jgi:hypothetical protein